MQGATLSCKLQVEEEECQVVSWLQVALRLVASYKLQVATRNLQLQEGGLQGGELVANGELLVTSWRYA